MVKTGNKTSLRKHDASTFVLANVCWNVCALVVLLLGWLSCCLFWSGNTFGQWGNVPALQENFDTDQPSWEMLSIDTGGIFLERKRVDDVAITGKSETYLCEFYGNGIYFVGHSILLPCLVEDLNAGVWVRSQETGIICALEIVLPKSTDKDGKPVTLLLPGSQYTNHGEWQQLRVKADIPELSRQAKTLQLELGVPIDTSQAYIRRLVLCCFTENRTSRIWIDDLSAEGIVTIPEQFRRENKSETDFNPKNIVWMFRKIGIYNDLTTGLKVEATPVDNWTLSRKVEQQPTISHYDRPTQQLDSPINNPIAMASYPNDGDTIVGMSGRTTVLPPDRGITSASYDASIEQRSSPLTRLIDQPDLNRYQGEFSDHILQDRISRGKPHDDCRITAQSKMLWINGTLPYGVRAVEYRGEPLTFLVSLQFNTIWLRQPPDEALLEEAWRLGVWVICPPPDNDSLRQFVDYISRYGMTEDGRSKADGSSLKINGRMFARNRNPILAWDVGRNWTLGMMEQFQQRVQLVRDADIYRRIPLICSADNGTRDFSYLVNIMLVGRDPILSSLELNDYNAWLNTKVNWARAGTPNWCMIQTQPTAAMANQWRLFGTGDIPATAVSEEHVRLQVRMAMANECRGLLFTSNSRLDASDAETKYRAALLELVNMELMLIDGWFSATQSIQTVRSNTSGVTGILLTTSRAKLLLPYISKPFGQYVMGNTNCNNVDFLLPGSFETHPANHLMPGGTRPLTLDRVTGGVQVRFDEVNTTTAAFFAQDVPILQAVIPRSRHPELSRRSAELAIQLAKMRLEQVRKTIRAFQEIHASREGLPHLSDGFPIITMPEQDSMLNETERSINTAESYFQQADYSSAYLQAHRSIAGLQYYERLKWEEAIRKVPHHNMIPTSASFVTLPAYIETIKKMWRKKPGENRLPAGDAEDATLWQQAGWLSRSTPTEGIMPVVTVGIPTAARSGRGGLQMGLVPSTQIASTAPATGGLLGGSTSFISGGSSGGDAMPLETAPLWVTTPQIPVYAGDTLCITGYVNIPQRLQGNVDGLMIFDSLGGEPLTLRFTDTGGEWREFALFRAVPNAVPPNASMCVTFALSGMGEVWLDDLRIFPILDDPNAPATTDPPPAGSNWLQLPQLPQLPQLW